MKYSEYEQRTSALMDRLSANYDDLWNLAHEFDTMPESSDVSEQEFNERVAHRLDLARRTLDVALENIGHQIEASALTELV